MIPSVDCIVCGQEHKPTHFLCAECHQLLDRDLRIEESVTRRALISAGEKTSAMVMRDAFIRDPAYVDVGRRVYAQAKARIDASLCMGHVNERLRKERALVHLD